MEVVQARQSCIIIIGKALSFARPSCYNKYIMQNQGENVKNFNDFVTVDVKAKEWNLSHRRVQHFCNESRIPGAILVSNIWFIPAEAVKPVDGRSKKSTKIEG
ncbi:hypothetical protein LJC55_03470 [Eubacteriales bacterium OttesenSCG-928-N14]|nr:hypothetical protein [Eubacteriales bacterium OttesenSCG-928-N14]